VVPAAALELFCGIRTDGKQQTAQNIQAACGVASVKTARQGAL
jgi:hypothetical protein